MDDLLILIGCIEERLTIRVFNLALGANPILTGLAFKMGLNEVALVEVSVTIAADKWLVVDFVGVVVGA